MFGRNLVLAWIAKSANFAMALIILVLAVVGGLSSCAEVPGKVSGGGTIPSVSGNPIDRANFGFMASRCDPAGPVKGRFNYHDKHAPGFDRGVKMNGSVIDAAECVYDGVLDESPCEFCALVLLNCPTLDLNANLYYFRVAYRSTNPIYKGTGTAYACVTDQGEGVNSTSSECAHITVESGPFSGYQNTGDVQGSIQAHICN